MQLPSEEVMAYQKGQHLRNQDALLSERVRAEVVRMPPVLLDAFSHDIYQGLFVV